MTGPRTCHFFATQINISFDPTNQIPGTKGSQFWEEQLPYKLKKQRLKNIFQDKRSRKPLQNTETTPPITPYPYYCICNPLRLTYLQKTEHS